MATIAITGNRKAKAVLDQAGTDQAINTTFVSPVISVLGAKVAVAVSTPERTETYYFGPGENLTVTVT